MEKFKGDKRTKEYKEWKNKFNSESKGLGDTIENITEATGIKKVVKSIFGDDCGCEERKNKLNKLFSYGSVECLTEDEYNFLVAFFKRIEGSVSVVVEVNERVELFKIHNRIFNINQDINSTCSPCLNRVASELKLILTKY